MKDESITIKYDTFGELLELIRQLPKRCKKQFYIKLTKGTYINANRKVQEKRQGGLYSDEWIVEQAKEAEKRTQFGELVYSKLSKGVNSAYGIGFIEGMVAYRESILKKD